jgi:hypothetical protein
MSGAGFQPAIQPGISLPQRRNVLAHLLHALNQPLTGLQCSLELAAAGPRSTDQYVQTLHNGLDLTNRMRDLVGAIRELVDIQQSENRTVEICRLDVLLDETIAELLPVAEAKHIQIQLEDRGQQPVLVDRQQLSVLAFRLFESILSLSAEGTAVQITGGNERDHAQIVIFWFPAPPPEHSPFSPPELGLLIAQAGWEHAGAEWVQSQTVKMRRCTIRMPLVDSSPHHKHANSEI